jgi:hypothetical protein
LKYVNNMSLFADPVVGRAGLGNALFPWARAELFARKTAARVLAPRWPGLRIGPYVRREPDKRQYSGMFFAPHHVSGLRRLAIKSFAHRVSEAEAIADPTSVFKCTRTQVVEFCGIEKLFQPLLGEAAFIREELWHMTTATLRPKEKCWRAPFIAFHVRRGDITRQGFSQEDLNEVKQFTPLSWFISMARALKKDRKLNSIPIVVFTDGSSEEVRELCAIGGVRLHERELAITDLWTMSRARLLFGSGFSTFSMWASFLGGMPTIYARNKIQQRVQEADKGAIEMELAETEAIPSRVACRVADRDS